METNDEIKSLLQKNLEAAENTRRVLKKIHRMLLFQWSFTFGKWILVIVLLIVGFLQLQPFIGSFLNNYQNILKTFEQLNQPSVKR